MGYKQIVNKIILVVEDNPDDEAMMRFALQMNQITHEIVVVNTGEDAMAYLFCTGPYADRDPNRMPSLILLDINLPAMNGFEVLRQIKQDNKTRLLPVVMLTTSDEEQDRLHSYSLCANSFIRKPVNFDDFVEIIRNIGVYWLEVNQSPPMR